MRCALRVYPLVVALSLGLVACGREVAENETPAAPPAAAVSADDHTEFLQATYDKSEHMVPMRDGTELYTIVYSPKDQTRE
ncbi:MAG: hypothetical protein OEU54_12980, partial [Gemmatimonadota bacterium]|nr:hypothetical protein [Gemmatimonadota bacterium]